VTADCLADQPIQTEHRYLRCHGAPDRFVRGVGDRDIWLRHGDPRPEAKQWRCGIERQKHASRFCHTEQRRDIANADRKKQSDDGPRGSAVRLAQPACDPVCGLVELPVTDLAFWRPDCGRVRPVRGDRLDRGMNDRLHTAPYRPRSAPSQR